MELKGTAAVVTGAARGIGKAIAKAYIDQGARVVLVDILADTLKETAAAFESAGATVLPIPADITVVEQVDAMAEKVRSEFGAPAILVNNAGSLSALGPVWEVDPQRWARDVTVNLIGTFLVTRAFLGDMVAQKRGYIINLIGGGVDKPHLYTTGYDTSKAGVARLTEAVAKEAADYGIKTFVLTPGTVRTEMTRFIRESPEGRKWRPTFEKIFAEGRDVPPDLAADWCVQLVSGRADALTGRWFSVNTDFEQVLKDADRICAENLNVLRLR